MRWEIPLLPVPPWPAGSIRRMQGSVDGRRQETSGQVLVNRQRARQTLQAEKSKLPSSPLIRPSAHANVL